MTKDDITRMAHEAGMQTVFSVIEEHQDGTQTVIDHRPFLERFANLVAAAEREAMVTEAAKQGWVMKNEDSFEDAVQEIAAIRARGEK